MSIGYGHVQEVNDDNKHKEHNYVENDDVHIPCQFLQPVNYSEGTKELCKVGYYFCGFPLVNQL